MRYLVALSLLALAGCVTAAPLSADPHSSMGAGAARPVTIQLGRSATTISGQPLHLPQGAAEAVAAIIDIPVGGATPIHQHPWQRFVYVERGPVRIVNHDTGQSRDFQSGQFLPEVVAQWHEGQAIGPGPVRLVVIDVVPPGVNNTVMKP